MRKIKIETAKIYSLKEYVIVSFPKNSKSKEDLEKTCKNGMEVKIHDLFVIETNKYTNLPTPKYTECNIIYHDFTMNNDDFRDGYVIGQAWMTISYMIKK